MDLRLRDARRRCPDVLVRNSVAKHMVKMRGSIERELTKLSEYPKRN